MTTPTMRERLCRAACLAAGLDPDRKYSSSSDHPSNAPYEFAWQEFGQEIDAILVELQYEAAAKRPDHEGVIYEMARAIGLADSGTDLESIASGRGSYITYMECAQAAFTAMIDAIRGGQP